MYHYSFLRNQSRRGRAGIRPPRAPARPKGRGKNRGAKTHPADAAAKAGKLSALDAAARVLAEEGRAMGCQEMILAMAAKGYWTSPGGKTPAATLYTVVTMLPKWAPGGAVSKRAWVDPIADSDLLVLDLDAFHQTANDFPPRGPISLLQPLANPFAEGVQMAQHQAKLGTLGGASRRRGCFPLHASQSLLRLTQTRLEFAFVQ